MWEDLTKRISPRRRMALLAVGALAAAWGLEATIIRTDIPGLDWVAAWPAGAVLLALFVVLGVSNAINIIDGFNGLASMCSVIMLAGLGAVALQVGGQCDRRRGPAAAGRHAGPVPLELPARSHLPGRRRRLFPGFHA
ncbi:MAG: glycosyltransferase [Inhella sp.]